MRILYAVLVALIPIMATADHAGKPQMCRPYEDIIEEIGPTDIAVTMGGHARNGPLVYFEVHRNSESFWWVLMRGGNLPPQMWCIMAHGDGFTPAGE